MNQNETMTTTEIPEPAPTRLKSPWYVYLTGGYALTGLFAWYLFARQLWYRNQKKAAWGVMFANTTILFAIFWLAMAAEVTWWWFSTLYLPFNLAWSCLAWYCQRWRYGVCEKRLIFHEWKRWAKPVVIAMSIGACTTMAVDIMPTIGERASMAYSDRADQRTVVLWQFFENLPLGLLGGLILGLWWAGRRDFATRHIGSFLGGIGLLMVFQVPIYLLFLYLVHGGMYGLNMLSGEQWSLVPYVSEGWRRFLLHLGKLEYIAFLVVGLLFGAPAKIRLFFKRAAVIVPVVAFLSIPMTFFSNQGWEMVQGQIVYQLSSPDAQDRHSAFNWLEVMLARYPNHANWPYLASRLADYQYEKGEAAASRKTYRQIIDRFGATHQWKPMADKCRAMIDSPDFGKQAQGKTLPIPLVSYQPHLTQNWMALLANLRYLNGPDIPESDITIRLMEISNSQDRIELPDLTDLADVDDAARSMNYGVVLLPSDPDMAKRLIENDIPVLLPVFQSFYLLYGYDDALGVVKAYGFGQLSPKIKHRAKDEADEILMTVSEEKGTKEKRIKRIAQEAQCQWPLDLWKADAFSDAAPLMAVVHLPDQQARVHAVLGNTPEFHQRRHEGYLAALIGLSFAKRGDPVNCIRWAQESARKISAPLPYQVAHAGQTLWENRIRKIGAAIGLKEQFEILAKPATFFEAPPTLAFTQQARERYNRDLKEGKLPWIVRHMMESLLDQTDETHRNQIIALRQYGLARHPSDKAQWLRLADAYELDGDTAKMSQALLGASSADDKDALTKLSLAAAYVKNDRIDDVEKVLEQIDPGQVGHEADYPYCLGVVSESKGDAKTALNYYATAIDMCRFRPDYHLRYARLLLDQGKTDAAKKALVWAGRITSEKALRKEVDTLLLKMN